jgi:hypothetical protein
MNFDPMPEAPARPQPRPVPRRVPTRIDEHPPFSPISVPSPESVGVVPPVVIPSPGEVGIDPK